MNLLKDIAKIVKDDKEHNIEVKVASSEVVVYLEYDPEQSFDSKCIIPIAYEPGEEIAYIPHNELVKIFNPSDFGITLNEVKLIKKIMKYMEKHSVELNELCGRFDLRDRHDYWGE